MNGKFRNVLLGAGLLGLGVMAAPAFAADTTSVTTDPDTGATTTVQHHGAILPKNRSTDVTVTQPAPVAPAPDVVGDAPSPPDAGPDVEQQTTTTTTVQHY